LGVRGVLKKLIKSHIKKRQILKIICKEWESSSYTTQFYNDELNLTLNFNTYNNELNSILNLNTYLCVFNIFEVLRK
jgi:hypothetical protein